MIGGRGRDHDPRAATTPINLRSDTQTLPTAAMRRAMADAELGDEAYREDPTVRLLEDVVASTLAREAALLVLSGTMANLVALLTICQRGDQVFADAGAHVVLNEAGGFASVAGLVLTTVASERGHILPDELERAIPTPAVNHPRPKLLWFEDTHNVAGGTVLPPERFAALMGVARHHGLSTHMDGARLFNAAVALRQPVAALVEGVDSIYIDFTKGLGCPLGSMLVGSRDYIDEARFHRAAVGGGMRQAGVIAAAALVALQAPEEQLAEDHRLARLLAEGLVGISGFTIDPAVVETNIVNVGVGALGTSSQVSALLAEEGLLVSERPPSTIRLVTHRDIDQASVGTALRAAARVSERVHASGQAAR
jgi:threonine aldolase